MNATKIASAFVTNLREQLAPDEWATMCARNRDEPSADVCHSHDWVDANMAMQAAFEQLNVPIWAHDDDAEMLESAISLWNAAWALAKPALRGSLKSELLLLLAANDGALLHWQIPAYLAAVARNTVRLDPETDCYVHPFAVAMVDGAYEMTED